MAKISRGYGLDGPLQDVFPQPVVATRIPGTGDKLYPVGQVWINKSTDQAWFLTSVSAGSATWALASPGASDVDTINSLSPTAGNIVIEGGTNITDSNAGSTVTLNLDAAITLATSVTSPLYTASAADVAITAPSGQDIVLKVGDNAGANKLSLLDSDDVEVFSVDSNGGQTYTTITASGLITGQASATIDTAGTTLSLATDNSGDAVILGGGTAARAITIGQDAAAHTVAIGQAAAGAITIDTAAGVSIDAATASNFSLSGAGADLTLASGAGRVVVNGEEAAANAITFLSAAGGIDADCALQMNLASSQNAADAIVINASAGGIDVTAAGAAGEDLDLVCTSGSVNITAGEDTADSVVITSSNGGIDILASGAAAGEDIDIVATGSSVNVTSTENVADAIVLSASAGGIDVTAAGAAGEDLDLTCTSGSVNISGGEAAADAVTVAAASGGIDVTAGGGAGLDLDLTCTSGSVNVTAGEDDAGAIYIRANGGTSERIRLHADQGTGDDSIFLESDAGGITLTSNTDITVNGTVKEIDAEFLFASGTDLTVTQSPILQSNATTGAAPTGSNGDVNLMYMQDGCLMEQFIIGTQTIIAPRMTANGLNLALDNTMAEGSEYNFGARNNAKHAYTIGTSDAFFIEATIYVEDLSGCDPLMVGFRKVEANNATLASYTDYACIGLNQTTSATNVVILDELNSGGQTATDTTDAWGGDGSAQTVKVLVSGAGVVTFEVGGSAASAAPAYTFDSGDVVMPFIHFLQGADVTTTIGLQNLKIGFQA